MRTAALLAASFIAASVVGFFAVVSSGRTPRHPRGTQSASTSPVATHLPGLAVETVPSVERTPPASEKSTRRSTRVVGRNEGDGRADALRPEPPPPTWDDASDDNDDDAVADAACMSLSCFDLRRAIPGMVSEGRVVADGCRGMIERGGMNAAASFPPRASSFRLVSSRGVARRWSADAT